MKKTNSKEQVLIGKAGSPVGLKGESSVTLYQKDSDNLKEGKVLLLKHAGDPAARGPLSAKIEHIRYQKGRPIVKLEGIDDRTAAGAVCGMEIYIDEHDLEPLPEGEHYVRDLIGCRVIDLAGGKEVGVLRDVIQNTAQSILEVEQPGGSRALIPAVDEFMRGIDEEKGIINVELIPGFLE